MSDQQQHARYQQFVHPGSTLGLDIGRLPQAHHGVLDVMQAQSQMSPPNSAGSAGAHSASPSFLSGYHSFVHSQPHHPSFPPNMHQSSPTPGLIPSQTHGLSLDPSQLRAPSVGPSRVLTRRQARLRSAALHPYNGVGAGSSTRMGSNGQDAQPSQAFDESVGFYNSLSRPQTPHEFAGGAFNEPNISLPDLSFGSIAPHSMSPPHPGTPASAASSANFSQYGFTSYHSNGHVRTISGGSTNKRSTSPAASVVSAVTSISSGHGGKPDFPQPPITNGSISGAQPHPQIPEESQPQYPAVKPKRRLLNKQRKEICQYHIDHPSARQEDIASQWGVERSTVSKILKHKNRWLAVDECDNDVVAKHRPAKFAVIEERMHDWLVECQKARTPISDVMIRLKAKEVAKEVNVSEDKFKASAGWVENYKHRMGIKKGVWGGWKDPGFHDGDEPDFAIISSSIMDRDYRNVAQMNATRAFIKEIEGAVNGDVPPPSAKDVMPGVPWNPSTGLGMSQSQPLASDSVNGSVMQPGQASDAVNQGVPPHLQLQVNNNGVTNQQTILQPHYVAARASYVAHGGNVLFAPNVEPASPTAPPKGTTASEANDAYEHMDAVIGFLNKSTSDFFSKKLREAAVDLRTAFFVLAGQTDDPSPTSEVPDTNFAANGSNTSAQNGTAIEAGPSGETLSQPQSA